MLAHIYFLLLLRVATEKKKYVELGTLAKLLSFLVQYQHT